MWFLLKIYDGRCFFWPEIKIISWYAIPPHKYDNPLLLCTKSIDLKTCVYSLYVIQIAINIKPLYVTPLHKYDKCYLPYIKCRSEDASLHLVYMQ